MGYSAKKLIKIIKLQDINHDGFDYDKMSEIKIALVIKWPYFGQKYISQV